MDLKKSSMSIFAAQLIRSLISFIAVIVFSRELGASPLGTYYPFIALLGIVSIPADIGIRSATEKRISEGTNQRYFLGTAIVMNVLPLSLMILLILSIDNYITQYLGADLATALAIALVFHNIGKLGLSTLRGELRVVESAIAMTLRPIGWLLVGWFLFTQGFGVYGIVYGYIVGSFAMLVVAWSKVSLRPKWPGVEYAKSLFDYGRYSFISRIGGYFHGWMDVAILSGFVALGITSTRSAIGAYENAWRVSVIALLIGSSIGRSLFPQVSRWDAEGATNRIESVIPKALLPGLLVVFPAFVGSLVLSEDIMSILFGPEFTIASTVLVILVFEKIFQSFQAILGRALLAIDQPRLAAFATVSSIITNLVLNIVLIWYYGIVGAALATTTAFSLNTILSAQYLRSFLQIEFPTRKILWSILSSVIMGIALFGIHSIINVSTIVHLLGLVLFGVVVYFPVVMIYQPVREDMLEFW